MTDQLEAFHEDFSAQPPDRRLRWYCTRCGSEAVLGVSVIDARSRYGIAARCTGCHKTHVTVQRDVKDDSPDR